MVHGIDDPSISLEHLSSSEPVRVERLVIGAAGSRGSDDKGRGVDLGEVTEEEGSFGCSNAEKEERGDEGRRGRKVGVR